LSDIDAFDLSYIDVHGRAQPTFDDHVAVCNNDFCALLSPQRKPHHQGADQNGPQDGANAKTGKIIRTRRKKTTLCSLPVYLTTSCIGLLGCLYIASIFFVSHRGCDGRIPVVACAWRETPKTKDRGQLSRGEIKTG
jgi:hypothetical protein